MAQQRRGGFVGRIQEVVEERTGFSITESDHLNLLEAEAKDARVLRKELDLLGWTVMDYLSGAPQEMRFENRRKLAQQARMVWAQDPQAGASVDLSNDFVLGRGVPRPKCRDPKVQEIVDEAWDDPVNQLVLTSYEAQVALNTDLEIQSNLFLVMFDDGEDGKVKLGLLDHDTVEQVVRDPDNRLRVLYYVAKMRTQEWDFDNDKPALPKDNIKPKTVYYPHWSHVEAAEDEDREEPLPKPPAQKLGKGKVRHVAVNRTSEMAFGVPSMWRTIRWFSSYNSLVAAQVDKAQAVAAFIMKRKVEGTPGQLSRLAAKAISRRSDLATGAPEDAMPGPRAGSILNENTAVTHEPLKLDSGASNAMQDGQLIRAQISAATRWTQAYLGDPSSSSLATATSLELPILKKVEARQEVWESVFRWFIDRVIEKAVEDGLLDRYAEEEVPEEVSGEVVPPGPGEFGAPDLGAPAGAPVLGEAHEDQSLDEERTERDLSYEFSMPNPLKRMMTDLVGAVANVARTFDPNNTNPELSRILLAIVLGEGFEQEDPQALVDRILPEGYEDPAVAAARQAAQQQQQPPPPEGAPGADGEYHDAENPYGAPMQSSAAGEQYGFMQQARFQDLPEQVQLAQRGRMSDVERLYREEVGQIVDEALVGLVSSNGNTRRPS